MHEEAVELESRLPLWHVASAHAIILVRNNPRLLTDVATEMSKLETYNVVSAPELDRLFTNT